MISKLKEYWYRQDKVAYIFLAPSIVILFMFAFIPLVCSVVISVMNLDIFFSDVRFAGLANFLKAFGEIGRASCRERVLCSV